VKIRQPLKRLYVVEGSGDRRVLKNADYVGNIWKSEFETTRLMMMRDACGECV